MTHETIETVEQIQHDFETASGPFSNVEFPEERLLSEVKVMIGDTDEPVALSMEDRLRLVSAFATFDYNRNANQLVDNLLELQEQESKWFDPYSITPAENEVETVFKEIGFRYPSRDSHAWVTNCEILRNNYNGKWHELLMDTELDAVQLVDRLKDDDFLCIKGDKIAPMYARIINDEVASLDNLWRLDIPVDTHIERLSQDLFDDPSMDHDEIRREWSGLAVATDISRQIVDGALWHIGNKWDDWGEDYWEEVTA